MHCNSYYTGFFLDIFPQLSPTQVGETLSFSKLSLSFSKNSLSFSENSLIFSKNSLSLLKRMEFFSQNYLNFPNFELRLLEKLKFGQFFVQNISTSGLFGAKNQFLVGKLLSF